MTRLKRLVTGKVLDMFRTLGNDKPDDYIKFWEEYGERVKEGVAVEQDEPEKLFPLIRFRTSSDLSGWTSLAEYVERADPDQKEIYYFLGEDPGAVRYSPHMDPFRKTEIEVLVLSDPVDPFMLLQLKEFDGHLLVNIADAELPVEDDDTQEPEESDVLDENAMQDLVTRVKSTLGDRVSDVRLTNRLSDSPARLVDPEGAPDQSVQRVYQMMDKQFEMPKKVLELNPKHQIISGLAALPNGDDRFELITLQLFENTLLIEGLHPDPVSMVGRIQDLIAESLGVKTAD
jgi:molecular chaperone HtpG